MAASFPHITISVANDHDGSDATGDLNTLCVGFGLFQAWLLSTMFGTTAIFSPSENAYNLTPLAPDLASVILNAYVFSLAVFLLIAGLSNQMLLKFYVGKNALVMTTAIACVGSLLIFMVPLGGFVLAVLVGVLMGVSSSLMFVLWGTAYARYEFTTIILNTVVAMVIGVAAFLALANWVLSPFSGLIACVLPVGASMLLWRLTPMPYYRRREIPIFHPLAIRQGAFVVRFGVPTLIFGFALGVLREVCLLNVLPTADIASQLVVGASAFVAIIIIMFAVAVSRGESHWDMIFRMLVPFIGAAMLCLPYLASEYSLAASFIVLCGFICFESLMWIFFSDLSQEFRLSPIYVIGLGRAFLTIGALIGVALIEFPLSATFNSNLYSFETSLLLLFALVVAYCLLPRQREVKRIVSPSLSKKDEQAYTELQTSLEQKVAASLPPEDVADKSSSTQPAAEAEEGVRKGRFHAKCEEIADRYLLSRRETEVMFLLAKGHNAAYIQDKLCISKSTAKTHINHIYRKLDIHTQQELLNMVEEAGGR